MYSYALKRSYDLAVENDQRFINAIPKDVQWTWLMYRVRIKIMRLELKKWFRQLSEKFPITFPDAFKPNPVLVTIGGSVVILGLLFQLK